MNQFCERKDIKREFSVARTPQQNVVAERKNRTLIEAARRMLADSKLPTTFWAEAINTACYSPLINGFKPLGDDEKKVTKEPGKEGGDSSKNSESNDQEEEDDVYSTNTVNAASTNEVNVVGAKTSIELPDDPNIPELEDIVYSDDDEDVGAEADINNLKSNGNAGTKACDDAGYDEKKVTKEPGEEGGDSSKYSECNDQEKKDNVNSTNTVNVASINEVNDVGAKTSIELPDDPNMPELEDIVYSDDDEDVGAEADMNNLDAFMLVSPIPTTRIHKDHPVEQIIGDLNSAPQTRRMTKNLEEHARLVAQGYTQEEGIDYNDVFSPVARIEAIRLLLAYASFKDFVVYQMDVKSAFFMVKQKNDGIFINQDKYVTEILKKFGFTDVKTASTPMETQKLLLKDEDGEEVDVYLYRLMIGSLMYLTSSRPDSMFAVCAYARYQVNPKVSHLHAVKRIFSDYAST
ncbi:ribonuclease H-like domain-containing protein [Tanacetum coccineum]